MSVPALYVITPTLSACALGKGRKGIWRGGGEKDRYLGRVTVRKKRTRRTRREGEEGLPFRKETLVPQTSQR